MCVSVEWDWYECNWLRPIFFQSYLGLLITLYPPICMFTQRLITTLWKGVVVWDSGHLKLTDTAQAKAIQPTQSCSLVQKYQKSFRIRVWHTPLTWGSCLSNKWSSLRVEPQSNTYVYMYIYVCVYIYMYMYVLCVYMNMCVYVYVYIYVYIYVFM